MHAWITGGQELGIINGFLSMQAAEVDSSDTDIVDPLASLSSGLLGLIGVTGLLVLILLSVAVIGGLGLESSGALQWDMGDE